MFPPDPFRYMMYRQWVEVPDDRTRFVFKDALKDGLDPYYVLTAWMKGHYRDDSEVRMGQLNYILYESIKRNNIAMVKALCNMPAYAECMQDTGGFDGFAQNREEGFEHLYDEGEYDECVDPLERAIKSRKFEIARLLFPISLEYSGNSPSMDEPNISACNDLSLHDVGRIIVSDRLYKLICDKSSSVAAILKAWEQHHGEDSPLCIKAQFNWMLSMCVVHNNTLLAEVLCKQLKFIPTFMDKYALRRSDHLLSAYPLQVRHRRDDPVISTKMIGILLRHGYEPCLLRDVQEETKIAYPPISLEIENFGKYYLSERVQDMVARAASPNETLKAWEKDHKIDLKFQNATHMEQLNWLLIASSTPDGPTPLAHAVLTHSTFPKSPEHQYKNNSPLYAALKNDDRRMISMLVNAGYSLTDVFCDDYNTSVWQEAFASGRLHSIEKLEVKMRAWDQNDIKQKLLNNKDYVFEKVKALINTETITGADTTKTHNRKLEVPAHNVHDNKHMEDQCLWCEAEASANRPPTAMMEIISEYLK